MPTFLSNASFALVDATLGFRHGTTATPLWKTGTGTPEGVVAAPVGSLYSRLDGGTDTAVYRKETGTGNTGWVATSSAISGVSSVDGRTGTVTLSDLYIDVAGDTMTGNLGMGVTPTSKLHFVASTTAAGGIQFGSDTNIYRSAVDTLRTDDSLSVGVRVDATSGFRHGSSTTPSWTTGTGTPEGVVTAPIGSLFSRTDGSTGTAVYRKESGVGNTGWVAVSTASGVASVDGRTGVVTLSDLYVDIAGDTMTGNLGLGAPGPTAKLQFAADTTAVGGILFGTDTTLYRSGPDVLQTDDAFKSAGRIEAALSTTAGGFRQGPAGPMWVSGSGTPEGAVTAPIGSLYSRTNGSANTTLYRKESGTLSTGWIATSSAGVSSVDGRNGTVVLSDLYVDITGDTMTGELHAPVVSVGIASATAGQIRLSNDDSIQARNAANTADLMLITMLNSNYVQVGANGQFGVQIGSGTARTLWVSANSNPTTAAGGITFGTSADTTLYRGAADRLVTDDSLQVAANLAVGTIPSTAYRARAVQSTSHVSSSGNIALRAENSWAAATNATSTLLAGQTLLTSNIATGITLTNAATDAIVAHSALVSIQGDGTYAAAANGVTAQVQKDGAGTLSEARSFLAVGPTSTTGGTISIASGLDISDQKVVGVTTGYGIYQRGASDYNYFNGSLGLGVTAPTARVQFAAATTVAGGILFGTDTNLYRSAADTLKTDDSLVVGVRVDATSGFRHGSALLPSWTSGAGTPEGVVTAPIGSLFSRTDGGTGTALYRKEAGTGNTGWVAVSSSAGGGVTSVDGRTGVVTLSDLYVDIAGDTMTGNLGMGVTPTSKLHFATATTTAGGIQFGSDTNLYRGAPDTLQTDDTVQVGGTQAVNLAPTGRAAIAAPLNDTQMLVVGATGGSNQFNSAVTVAGVTSNPLNAGTGSINGVISQPCANPDTGTVSALCGGTFSVRLASATAIVTSGRALYASAPSIAAGGIVTTAFGLDIAAQAVTGATNAYGIYQRGANDNNYFGGRVAIGSTDFSYALHVNRASGVTDGNAQAQRIYHSWTTTADTSGTYLSGLGVTMSVSNSAGNTFTNAAGESISGISGVGLVTGAGAFNTSVNGVTATISKYGTSTLSSGRAVNATSPNIVGGTIATATGVEIGSQKVTGVTTGYGIYQRGASDLNYFAGQVQSASFRQGASGPTWQSGAGSPEGVISAPVGSIYSRTDGGADTALYRKEVGAAATGWVATSSTAGGVTSVDGRSGAVTLSDLYVNVTGDTMSGGLTTTTLVSTSTVVASDWLGHRAGTLTAPFTTGTQIGAVINTPVSRSFHDVLRFLDKGIPTEEVYNGTVWSSRAVTTSIFDGTESTQTQVMDGTTLTGVRWTFGGASSVFGTDLAWLRFCLGYVVPVPDLSIELETSSDGTAWTSQINTAMPAVHATNLWVRSGILGQVSYARITLRVTNGRPVNVCALQGFAQSSTNQGKGVYTEYPYAWNFSKQIAVGGGAPANGPLTIGTNTTAASGGLWFGDDVNIYRSGPNALKTDDDFQVGSGNPQTVISSTGRVGIHSLGAQTDMLLAIGAIGVQSFTSTSQVYGLAVQPQNGSTGNTTGVFVRPISKATGSLIGVAVTPYVDMTAGTLTESVGLRLGTPTTFSGVTVTTAYGVDIQAQKTTGVTNGYGVYQRGTADYNVFSGITQFTNWVQMGENCHFSLGTTTGTKIGVATNNKIGFWNATPVVQNTGWSITAGYVADKSFNPEVTTVTELARILGTLIDALKSYGLLGP